MVRLAACYETEAFGDQRNNEQREARDDAGQGRKATPQPRRNAAFLGSAQTCGGIFPADPVPLVTSQFFPQVSEIAREDF